MIKRILAASGIMALSLIGVVTMSTTASATTCTASNIVGSHTSYKSMVSPPDWDTVCPRMWTQAKIFPPSGGPYWTSQRVKTNTQLVCWPAPNPGQGECTKNSMYVGGHNQGV
jgi:hypothetical protein